MTARLLLDEMYPPLLADLLRDKGHDVRAVAASVELAGADDATVLGAATAEDRCLLTENIRDFAVLARYATHAGLLLASSRRWPRTPDGIARLAAALHGMIVDDALPRHGDVRWLG